MSSVQTDSPAGWCTIAHCEKHDKLPRKGECFIQQASDVASKQSWFKPRCLFCLGCPSAASLPLYHNRKFTTVDQLKQAQAEEWNKLSQRFIDRSIDECRRRLARVVQQLGGHVEHIIVWISSTECWNCSNSVNVWCFVVYMTLYSRSWQGWHFFGTPDSELHSSFIACCQ